VGAHGVKLGVAPDAPRWGEVLGCLPPVRSASSGGLRLPRTFIYPLTATPARRGRCRVEPGERQLDPRPAIRRYRGSPELAGKPGLAPASAAVRVATLTFATRMLATLALATPAIARRMFAAPWLASPSPTARTFAARVFTAGGVRGTGACSSAVSTGLAARSKAAEGGPYEAAGCDDTQARYEAAWGWRIAQQVARPIGRSLIAGGSGRVSGRRPHPGKDPS
jgi:hypothetical protein